MRVDWRLNMVYYNLYSFQMRMTTANTGLV